MMFLLGPLLIAAIIYYTAADIRAYRKKRRRGARQRKSLYPWRLVAGGDASRDFFWAVWEAQP